ncbi:MULTISPECIES: MBL fold metallo-hydrolase [unclassified Prochlorococcus]|uniref:MBL fold metallo-hydrolase n=1 Tax=unclassified Prochlorococcus TaxID=2627481 RepID=UPI000533844C|nr:MULTISPECIES: MBL fold metallo-hydrolase [unclassified Prochlorococcus]KGG15520.1 hypothetical protein EV06_1394 [Prochlorococcus sp. MIT 0602]KGG17799.1 hypothetical protein EV07_1241 [Prochlorococcus sp. MIT 0603]
MNFDASYLGSSGWLIDLNGFRILIDPWLKGDLVFPPGPWLIRGTLNREIDPPQQIDLILLTQGLPDHAHPQTLELLDRSIPVVGSTSACKVVQKLGFQQIFLLKPGEIREISSITLEATAGANVPKIENGYIVSNTKNSFYIEPHGFLDQNLPARDVDTVITPVIDIKLPFVGSFIRGKSILPKLIKTFNPKIIISSTTGGDSKFTGMLNNLFSVDGTIEEVSKSLENKVEFIDPIIGKHYLLDTLLR